MQQQHQSNRTTFEALATRAARGDQSALSQLPSALAAAQAGWRQGSMQKKLWEIVGIAVQDVCSDDILSAAEEAHVLALCRALGLHLRDLRSNNFAAWEELAVARINDGRPPTLDNPPMILQGGETAFSAFNAQLLKEVAVREFRGRSSGVSVPIGLGMRYRTGSSRGRSVIIGSELITADAGSLVVTSTRAMFLGSQRTLEFRRDRLVGLEQFIDGIRLSVSNRQTASLFRFGQGASPTLAAALLSRP